MSAQSSFNLGKFVQRGKDVFLSHTGVDKPWVETLAEMLEQVRVGDRYLGVVFDKWDFETGKNIVLEIDRYIDECKFVALIVTKAFLEAEWPTLERTIAVWSDPSGRQGKVLVLLKENVQLPASLRIRSWIDFRDPAKFEDGLLDLIRVLTGQPKRRGRGGLTPNLPSTDLGYVPSPTVVTASAGPDRTTERLVSNLLPVTELPVVVQVASTSIRRKSELPKGKVPPCILREGKLYTFSDLHDIDNPLQTSIDAASLKDELFGPWFAQEDQRRWAIELLNVCFRQHCWQRWLRLDTKGKRYFFAPKDGQPKKIAWYIGGVKKVREVTTPHNARRKLPDGQIETYQFGWRHQGLRASFVHLPCGLFLQVEPTYLLTGSDGRSPRSGKRVGPVLSHWLNHERNGQILRSIRFWSLVLSRGSQAQLVIPTGHERIVLGLTPANGSMEFGILGDSIDYERLIQAEYEDDLAVPELAEERDSRQMNLFGVDHSEA
jgi:hypothetical protein